MRILDFLRKNIFIVLAVLIIAAIGAYYYIREYRASKVIYYDSIAREYVYEPIPRNYKINEYVNVNVTSEGMAKVYFNNYKLLIYRDINEAYLKLDENYRNKAFPTLESFENYMKEKDYLNVKLTKYTVRTINGYLTYILYDENDSMYVFKTDGVLQYTVKFDEDL